MPIPSLTHLAALTRSAIPPMHPAGRPFVAGAAAASVLLHRAGPRTGMLGLLGTVGCAAFFREPKRVPPQRAGVVVAPADGIVSSVTPAPPPAELGLGAEPRPRCSVFLSVFDVHVQRIPADGDVAELAYRPGAFVSADLDKASELNERNSMLLRTSGGHELAVVQVAGLVARRIVCSVSRGNRVRAGQTYGLIRFGSRVDLYLPPDGELLVRPGQRAVGGETVVAELSGLAPGKGG